MKTVTMVIGSISRSGGGVSEVVKLLSKELVRHGVVVNVLALEDEYSDADRPHWESISTRCFKSYGPKRFGFSPGLFWALMKCRSDVVHVHGLWQFQGLCVLLWSKMRSGRYVVTPHGMLDRWIMERSKRLKVVVSHLFQNSLLKNSASIHVLTDKERIDVSSMFPLARTDIIPNFVISGDTQKSPAWLTEKFYNKRIYLFFGRIHEKKGWRELCEAWDRLCSLDAEFAKRSALVFCGWVDGASSFEAGIEAIHSRHGNAIFVGPVYGEEKVASLQASDVFILPSKSEGLPMVILEAWSHGLPALMTRECNLPIGFESGAAHEIGQSADAIVAGLKLADSWSRDDFVKMSDAAECLVAEEFSPDVVAERFCALYEEIFS